MMSHVTCVSLRIADVSVRTIVGLVSPKIKFSSPVLDGPDRVVWLEELATATRVHDRGPAKDVSEYAQFAFRNYCDYFAFSLPAYASSSALNTSIRYSLRPHTPL
jgi:hypothetical protein